MPESGPDSTDQRLDEALGNLLRAGVLLAAAVVFLGAIVHVVSNGRAPEGHHEFNPTPDEMCHPVGVIKAAFRGEARGIIQLGLLLLIATPVARVLFTVFAFGKQRDWTYVVVTLIVLGLLLFSLFWGT